jgi:hypothetical protein
MTYGVCFSFRLNRARYGHAGTGDHMRGLASDGIPVLFGKSAYPRLGRAVCCGEIIGVGYKALGIMGGCVCVKGEEV